MQASITPPEGVTDLGMLAVWLKQFNSIAGPPHALAAAEYPYIALSTCGVSGESGKAADMAVQSLTDALFRYLSAPDRLGAMIRWRVMPEVDHLARRVGRQPAQYSAKAYCRLVASCTLDVEEARAAA